MLEIMEIVVTSMEKDKYWLERGLKRISWCAGNTLLRARSFPWVCSVCEHVVFVQSLSHVQLFVTSWIAGLPVLHHLPELAHTHVYSVHDTIQPSHPLSSPSPPALSLSQHQGLFQWVGSLHQVNCEYSWSYMFKTCTLFLKLLYGATIPEF